MKLAEDIKEQRELKGWSQEELTNILKGFQTKCF
ncbi:DNA-binding protein [Staphylococcus aureus]|nr:DNA-binding protein [Staphylococcus aureus]